MELGVFHEGRVLLKQKYACLVAGISPQAFQKWNCEPVLVKGRSKYYDIGKIIADRADREPSATAELQSAKVDLERERASKVRMDNQVRRGELLEVETVLSEVARAVYSMKARLLSLPAELAGLLDGASPDTIRRELDDGIRAALDELASSDYVDAEAAPAINGKRVGGRKSKAKPGGKRRARKVAH